MFGKPRSSGKSKRSHDEAFGGGLSYGEVAEILEKHHKLETICEREIERCNERENSLIVQWGFSERRKNGAKERTAVKILAFEDVEKRLAPVVNDTIFIESKNYYCEQIRAAQTKMNEENERLQKANWTLLLAPDNAEAKETYKDAKQKYLAASAEAEAERERGSLVLRYKQAKNELEQAKYDEKTINEEAAEKFNTLNEEIVQNKQRKKEVQAVLEKVTGTSRPTRS